jgi:hypothetical protein
MSFEQALELASREESFRASVYAMNTLLIAKGVYTREEFDAVFVEWVAKEQRRRETFHIPLPSRSFLSCGRLRCSHSGRFGQCINRVGGENDRRQSRH